MRVLLALLLLGLGAWQAVADWRDTIGAGYAYRLTPIGQVIADAAPKTYVRLITGWKETQVPYLWEPVGRILMALPAALVPIAAGVLLWTTRRRRR